MMLSDYYLNINSPLPLEHRTNDTFKVTTDHECLQVMKSGLYPVLMGFPTLTKNLVEQFLKLQIFKSYQTSLRTSCSSHSNFTMFSLFLVQCVTGSEEPRPEAAEPTKGLQWRLHIGRPSGFLPTVRLKAETGLNQKQLEIEDS